MKKKGFETFLYSAAGVVALAIVLVAANYLLSSARARVDLTDGRVYTLSDGTRAILGKLESPVKIRYYYTQGEAVPVALKTYAQRVEDTLNEYRAASGGKVQIEKYNPQPDSDAEDAASLDQIEGQMLNTGEKFYLGLAVSQIDQKVSIPVLTPERERLLEYDLTRAISRVATVKKPVVGVMSAVPVFGRGLSPMAMKQGQGLTEPWVLISELRRDFDLKQIDTGVESIDPEIKVLLVIHPRDVLEPTQYAIDQFVMRGGKLIAFLDPYMYFDQQRDMMNPLGGTAAGTSSLPALLKAWGLELDQTKVLADLTYASGAGPRLLPTLINLTGAALNADDVVTGQVGSLLYAFGGAFGGKPAEGLTMVPLAKSSPNNMPVDLIIATLSGEPSTRGFKPTGTEQPLALRLTGKFKSAFPDGKPKDPFADPKKEAEAEKKEPEKAAPAAPHLKEATAENTVVLVGDADMLTDNASVDIQDVFGQRVIVPSNGNLNFAQSLVEQMAADQNLIGLRSRAAFSRPLIVVKEMETKAQEAYLGKIKELEDDLQETQKKLEDLQKRRGDMKDKSQAVVLTPEQQSEVDNFRKRSTDTKKDLKELRRNLRQDADSLEFWTKVVNIGAMPLAVMLAGGFIAASRRRQAPK